MLPQRPSELDIPKGRQSEVLDKDGPLCLRCSTPGCRSNQSKNAGERAAPIKMPLLL